MTVYELTFNHTIIKCESKPQRLVSNRKIKEKHVKRGQTILESRNRSGNLRQEQSYRFILVFV